VSLFGAVAKGKMTTTEKQADDLGQIIFRIETNFDGYRRGATSGDAKTIELRQQRESAILADIEKLKELKTRILDTPNVQDHAQRPAPPVPNQT